MENYYLFLIGILFVLAATDLIVGVSNDAVNFLNSAIGSRVAPKLTIMIVASIGIFIGATFSSGMMEVARKGIFYPQYFYFSEIMIIFLAVMITDIILLDLFNSLGLPTSTTVSIVFELLGSAVVVALIKIVTTGQSLAVFADYINWGKAGQIIGGIFLAVFVAFTVGLIIQYFSRLLLTFNFKSKMNWVGPLWAGFAFTSLTFFLLIKGLKGASFVPDTVTMWVNDRTLSLMGISFVFWTVVMKGLQLARVNIFKIVVLFGTFSLAMAFAGNDLVNFIGVPLAGLEAFKNWSASGAAPEAFTMESLAAKVKPETFYLLGAGAIMILTLWFSKKARSVTATTVDLSRQEEGSERFKTNKLARGSVFLGKSLAKGLGNVIGTRLRLRFEQSFAKVDYNPEEGEPANPPAFDLVRASVNLVVASMLIAYGTSKKLPLSTTYVSFMVAMGASLADRAWGRDSAVYRIAGVFRVISGWLMTAIIAFSIAGLFAALIWFFEIWAVAVLLVVAVALMIRSSIVVSGELREKENEEAFLSREEMLSEDGVYNQTASTVLGTLKVLKNAYKDAINGLIAEDKTMVRRALSDVSQLKRENEKLRNRIVTFIRRIEDPAQGGSNAYLTIYDLEQDLLQSARTITEGCAAHVSNLHNPLSDGQAKRLEDIRDKMEDYLSNLITFIESRDYSDVKAISKEKKRLLKHLKSMQENQVKGIRDKNYGSRNSTLFFTILFETRDLAAVANRFAKFYARRDNPDVETE